METDKKGATVVTPLILPKLPLRDGNPLRKHDPPGVAPHFRNFLRGMETAVAPTGLRADDPSETSLEGWKPE